MDIKNLINYCYCKLPTDVRKKPWSVMDHGRDVIDDDLRLNAYLASYAEMHYTKCRAALQNFPFNELTSYEIIDWGCGQGLASLTLIEMLKERNKIPGLKRITLIDPSSAALDRAVALVHKEVATAIKIQKINEFIPGDTISKNLEILKPECRIVIHLFSNILDIKAISLRWVAEKLCSMKADSYVVTVGPKINNCYRLDDFCGYFKNIHLFCQISAFPYSYTSTNHAFGCDARCFKFKASEVSVDKGYQESLFDESDSFTDDYTYAAEALRGHVPDSLLEIYNNLRQVADNNPDFCLFIRPRLSIDIPDIAVAYKKHGILLLNVCDKPFTKDNPSYYKNDFYNIESMKQNLVSLHLPLLMQKNLENKTAYGLVKTALYIPNLPTGEMTGLEKDFQYVNIIRKNTISNINDLLKVMKLAWNNNLYDDNIHNEFLGLIRENHWHSYREGDLNLTLTKRQKELSESRRIHQKIKGTAGSGKTQVLASRAVNAQVRTGDRVLIITYNITLRNYIRHRMGQVAADFPWNMFDITNYHQFFGSQANNLGLIASLADYQNINFFEPVRNNITRYKTILIDEAQDFKSEWCQILKNYFLTDDGEFVVFGDGRQNIYGNPQESDHAPAIPVPGRWNEISATPGFSFRVKNQELISLFQRFQWKFYQDAETLSVEQGFSFEEYHIKYTNTGSNTKANDITGLITNTLTSFGLMPEDVTILAQNCSILRDVDYILRKQHGMKPLTTFETKEQFDSLCVDNKMTYQAKREIEKIRRIKKLHFLISTDAIKMSTIHSFKGWETKALFLILQPIEEETSPSNNNRVMTVHPEELETGPDYKSLPKENKPELIYTGLTRAMEHLFVINMGNNKYHEFFSQNLQQWQN